MAVIALDLGGTKLACAIVSVDGKILRRTAARLDGRAGKAVCALICGELRAFLQAAQEQKIKITAVGISVPGVSRQKTGTVWAPNIPGWGKYPLRLEIESFLRRGWRESNETARHARGRRRPVIPVFIESDRTCYILGESWRGAARGCRNAIYLAVGTGIGAGILADGQVLRGANNVAGAIGWLALDRAFRPEYSLWGCFEHHASGAGLARVARSLGTRLARTLAPPSQRGSRSKRSEREPMTTEQLFAAYERNDPTARHVINDAIQFWGMAVANLVSLFNPEKIIFGGGVFGPATRFLPDICSEAKKWAQPFAMKRVKLLPSKLGADAGLYGAACVAI